MSKLLINLFNKHKILVKFLYYKFCKDFIFKCLSFQSYLQYLHIQIYTMQSNQGHVKRKRRARNDPHQRDFVCPCGKSYLSYPALYTHIKNKHQGQTPAAGQITIPRGERSTIPINRDDAQSDNDKHLSSPDDALASVFNYFRGYVLSKQLIYTIEDIFKIFPADISGDMCAKTKQWQQIKSQPEKMNENGIKIVTIDSMIGKFIYMLVKKIDQGLLRQLVFVLLLFRKSLNYEYSKHLDRSQPQTPNLNFTSDSLGMRMLEHVNEFILCFFDIFSKPYKHLLQNPCFIGRPEREYICLTKFMFLFGRWTYLERFTHYKIRINNF